MVGQQSTAILGMFLIFVALSLSLSLLKTREKEEKGDKKIGKDTHVCGVHHCLRAHPGARKPAPPMSPRSALLRATAAPSALARRQREAGEAGVRSWALEAPDSAAAEGLRLKCCSVGVSQAAGFPCKPAGHCGRRCGCPCVRVTREQQCRCSLPQLGVSELRGPLRRPHTETKTIFCVVLLTRVSGRPVRAGWRRSAHGWRGLCQVLSGKAGAWNLNPYVEFGAVPDPHAPTL